MLCVPDNHMGCVFVVCRFPFRVHRAIKGQRQLPSCEGLSKCCILLNPLPQVPLAVAAVVLLLVHLL